MIEDFDSIAGLSRVLIRLETKFDALLSSINENNVRMQASLLDIEKRLDEHTKEIDELKEARAYQNGVAAVIGLVVGASSDTLLRFFGIHIGK